MKKVVLLILLFIVMGCSALNDNEVEKVAYVNKRSEYLKNFKDVKKGVIIFHRNDGAMDRLINNINQNSEDDIQYFMMEAPSYSELNNSTNANIAGSINYLKDGEIFRSDVIDKDYNPDFILINIKNYYEDGISLCDEDIEGLNQVIDLTKQKPVNNDDSIAYFAYLTKDEALHQDKDNNYIKQFNNDSYETNTIDSPGGLNDQLNVLGKQVNENYSFVKNNEVYTATNELKINNIDNHSAIIVTNNNGDITYQLDGNDGQKFVMNNDDHTRYTSIKSISNNLNDSYYLIIDKLKHEVYKSKSLIFDNGNQLFFYNNYGLGAIDRADNTFYLLTQFKNDDILNNKYSELQLVGDNLHHVIKSPTKDFEYNFIIPNLQNGIRYSKDKQNFFENYIDIEVEPTKNSEPYIIDECLDLGANYDNDKVCTMKANDDLVVDKEYLGFFNNEDQIYGLVHLDNSLHSNLRLLSSEDDYANFLLNYGYNVEVLNIDKMIFDKDLMILSIVENPYKINKLYNI